MKEIFLIATIFGLFTLGLFIALESGRESRDGMGGLRTLAANASFLLLRLMGYGAGLLALHHAVGAPSIAVW